MEEFNINKIYKSSFVVIVGKMRTGKTTLAKDILYNLNIKNSIVFNEAEQYVKEYSNFLLDEKNVHHHLIDMDKFLNYQLYTKFVNPLSLTFDNVNINEGDFQDRTLTKLFHIHRYYNIQLILTTRHLSTLSPIIRNQIDYLFISKHSESDYLTPDRKRMLKDYEYLVVDNTNYKYYKYKAKTKLRSLSKKVNAGIIIQAHWRRVLAQRRLKRLRICNEIEYLPVIGIRYKDGMERFNENKEGFIY